ncbi:MAG: hypothetical protein WBA57_05075 [Elainellaceae cyanobacterium]
MENFYVKVFCAYGAGAADLELGQMNVEKNAAALKCGLKPEKYLAKRSTLRIVIEDTL